MLPAASIFDSKLTVTEHQSFSYVLFSVLCYKRVALRLTERLLVLQKWIANIVWAFTQILYFN